MFDRDGRKKEFVDRRQEMGQRAEHKALKFLQSKGYEFLEARYRTRYGELDLVMRDKATLVFVEVKSREGCRYGSPEESVRRVKQTHLAKAALIFISAKGFHEKPLRFDVVSITGEEIQHFQDAFWVDHFYY